ncbi:MAG TPA: Ger(x)C family spore germination protein [Clostridia bacterium]
MQHIKSIILAFIVLSNTVLLTSCWNYREIDKLAVVAGVAVDKGTDHKYRITVETIQISGGKDTKPKSKLISVEGDTMFDAARNEISLSGKRLYWSHAKVIILSKEIARNGAIKVIDWYNRDSETRADVNILISGGETAREIFEGQETSEDIKSFNLYQMIQNERSLSKAPNIEIWKFINDLELEGISPVIPSVILKKTNNEAVPHINGSAIFSHDGLIGFINEDESKDLLFIRNEVKAGVLVQMEQGREGNSPVSLEIFDNKTRVNPSVKNDLIDGINISTDTRVAIDEIDGSENYIDDAGRKKLERDAEKTLESNIEQLIKKVQEDYGVDIFGFGAKIHEDYPGLWSRISNNWKKNFKNLKISINSKIDIRNSAMTSKTVEIGD